MYVNSKASNSEYSGVVGYGGGMVGVWWGYGGVRWGDGGRDGTQDGDEKYTCSRRSLYKLTK